jgi:hypothetical protein
MRVVDTSIPALPSSRPLDILSPGAVHQPTPVAPDLPRQLASAQQLAAALRQQADMDARQAGERSGATAEARTWLRSRSMQKAILDLTIMVLDIQKRLENNNGKA